MTEIRKKKLEGRIDNPDVKERIHQVIEDYEKKQTENRAPVFLGFSSDEGVKRNKGHAGAAEGPFKVREQLAGLPYTEEIYDYGTVMGTEDLESAQQALGSAAAEILKNGDFPLIIGGGHETLYGHYLGVREAYPDAKIAVLNFDAHFDLRIEDRATSGTMFYQILTQDADVDYYVLGIQESGNTGTLFDTADALNVNYAKLGEMRRSPKVTEYMFKALENYDFVFATVCMDSIAAAYAPGVSMSLPNGFTSMEIHDLVERLAGVENLVSFDISETAPPLDEGGRTSALAASLFHKFLITKDAIR